MKTQFTPGPWKVIRTPSGYDHVRGSNNERISHEVTDLDLQQDEVKANAHLIATAPEMYDLLDKINSAFYTRTSKSEWISLMELTKPLLTKARGENV